MTLLKPHLFLNRLVVISHAGGVVYDEKFHNGVNIIRGHNSSGKSTIANFIFFSLGGEFKNWTTEAKKCREVFAEVKINQTILTLKRAVTEHTRQPMSIYWGDYETAKRSNFEGWKNFPYQLTSNRESFSNILFNALEFPEVRSSDDSKITMNQVLRLLYIDQDSPTLNLFRFETFDLPVTRQAISELLLGVYDDSLYRDRLNLRETERSYQQKKEQFEGILSIFGSSANEIDIEKLQEEIEKTRSRLNKEQEEASRIRARAVVTLRSNTPLKIERLQGELSILKSQIASLSSEITDFEFDILDSSQFIEVLEKRVIALEDSTLTRKILGELQLEYCPLCLSRLEDSIKDSHCVLCKQPVEKDMEKTYAKRLRQEIQIQIKESKKLLDEKKRKLMEISGQIPPLIEKYRLLQREIDLEEKESRSTRDEKLDDLLINKGRLESHLESLSNQVKYAEQLELLKNELQELKQRIDQLKLDIKSKEDKQRANLQKALSVIQDIALSILQSDLDRQAEFKTANVVEIDFLKDTFSLDGENNFSASSNTYLKNAVRFAIFFASLRLAYFRYPRFIICDNMEDKGMEQERTRNFQRVITEASKSYDVEHQIIFTTSMIEPTLDNSEYCIGPHYSENNKTLKI